MEIRNKVTKLAGGGPAFVSYTNVPQPQPTAPAVSGGVAETKDKDDSAIEKSLLQALYKEGLISDTDAVASEINGLFDTTNPFNAGNTATAYRRSLQLIARLREGKSQLKDAISAAQSNGAFNEMAITTDGRYYVMGEDGLEAKETLSAGDRVLTNADLAQLRANSIPYANNLSTVIANSVSMDQVNKVVWDLIGKIGKDKTSKEFFKTKKGQTIKEGLDELIAAGEDGVYKITEERSDQTNKAKAALTYLLATMPTNAKALLRGKAALAGMDPNEGAYQLLAGMVSAGLDSEYSVGVAYDKQATNGASTDEKGNKKVMDIKPITSYYMGENGVQGKYVLNPGQGHRMEAPATYYATPMGQDGKLIGQGSLTSFLNSGIGGIVDNNSIYIGNQKLDSSNFGEVVYDGTQLARAILPYTYDQNGAIAPDFELLPNYIEAQKEIDARGDNISAAELQQILIKHELDNYLVQDANGNLTWDPSKFRPFLMTNVYASGEDPWLFGKKKGAVDVDRAGEGYMTNIRSMPNVSQDNVKNLFKGLLGMNPHDDIFRTVAYMPLMDSAGLALNVAGTDPTVPATWGDMEILKRKAAGANAKAQYQGASLQ